MPVEEDWEELVRLRGVALIELHDDCVTARLLHEGLRLPMPPPYE